MPQWTFEPVRHHAVLRKDKGLLYSFWQYLQRFFDFAGQMLRQLSGIAGCVCPGLTWLHMFCEWLMLLKGTFRPSGSGQHWRTFLQSACQTQTLSKLETYDITLSSKTALLRLAFYGDTPKHLSTNHGFLCASLYATHIRWMGYFIKGEVPSDMDFNQFACAQNLREINILCAFEVLDRISCHHGEPFPKLVCWLSTMSW